MLISIITATYNRASTLARTIESVLNQDHPEWELIIVDDGSTDNTAEVLARYTDPRIRVFTHPYNRGVCAAKNTGLDHIRGEWFTILDSDDEAKSNALSWMLHVLDLDPGITAITCNCQDAATGELTGHGLDHDQYLDLRTEMQRCWGEHWGLTRTSLLDGNRFNEKIQGFEGILWSKISLNAKRYYIHVPLRIMHTEGQDRISKQKPDIEKRIVYYRELQNENQYLNTLKKYNSKEYASILYNIGIFNILAGDLNRAWQSHQELKMVGTKKQILIICSGLIFGSRWLRLLFSLKDSLN